MNDEQLLRFSRHILLPEIDVDGQQKLLAAHVLILGLGGLGSPVALYLAAAGVGRFTLVDFDQVDASNLQRQIAHKNNSVGLAKVESAKQSMLELNPFVQIDVLTEKLSESGLAQQLEGVDVLIDCTDRFSSRFTANAASLLSNTPLVTGAAIGFDGQVVVFDRRRSDEPCYGCLYPGGEDEGMSCAQSGVIAPLVGVVGSLQALEALKLLLGIGIENPCRIQFFDARNSVWQSMALTKNKQCPECS